MERVQTMRVSDHVVLRYMQRKLGLDVDAVRRKIEAAVDTRGTRRMLAFAGDVPWRVRADGMVYCVRDGTVTTCFDDRARRSVSRGGDSRCRRSGGRDTGGNDNGFRQARKCE